MTSLKIIPTFNTYQLNKMLENFKEKTFDKIILLFERAGEEFVKYARENGDYRNRTGNLRSSVGYIIAVDGNVHFMSDFKPIQGEDALKAISLSLSGKTINKSKIKDYSGKTGSKTGIEIAEMLAKENPFGIVLIGVAGMEYGKYVEAMGKDVITGAAIHTEEFIKNSINALMSKLK